MPRVRQDIAPSPPTVTFSIKASDGSYETHVTIPLDSTPEVRNDAIGRWLQLAQVGMQAQALELNALVPLKGESNG